MVRRNIFECSFCEYVSVGVLLDETGYGILPRVRVAIGRKDTVGEE